MKIVHVIVGLGIGGAESMLYKLLSASRSHTDITVISLTNRGVYAEKLEAIGVKVFTLGLQSGEFSFASFKHLVKLLSVLNPNVVQGWMYHANIAVSLVSIIPWLKFGLIWNIRHSLHDMSSEKKLTRVLIKLGAFLSFLPNKIIFNSNESLRQHEKIGYSKNKLVVVPNGFDLDVYKPINDARVKMLASLSLPKNSFLIATVARFHLAKGYKYFVKAATQVARKNKRAHFILVGRNVDSNNRELVCWINDTGYGERFHLLGEQKDTCQLFPSFTLLVSSSTTEAFPNVIGEAMGCEVPCVVTDVGDSKKIVGDCGITVPAKNSDALSDAILRMLSLEEKEFQVLRKKSRKKIIDNYSIDVVAKRYKELYVECSRQS